MDMIPVGQQLRQWRERRRMSQMELALDTDISTRHLSFIETGRSKPSTGTLERLAERLEVPLRARNALLLAAGFAPEYGERSLDAPEMEQAQRAIEHILKGHEPYPAIAVDRFWNIVAANDAISFLTEQISPGLMAPPVNALKLALHPDGLAPQIANFAEWRSHIIERLDRQVEASADAALAELRDEIAAYPHPGGEECPARPDRIWVPLILDTTAGRLSFISTIAIFGTPVDVTLAEIAIEAFFPADAESAERLHAAWSR